MIANPPVIADHDVLRSGPGASSFWVASFRRRRLAGSAPCQQLETGVLGHKRGGSAGDRWVSLQSTRVSWLTRLAHYNIRAISSQSEFIMNRLVWRIDIISISKAEALEDPAASKEGRCQFCRLVAIGPDL